MTDKKPKIRNTLSISDVKDKLYLDDKGYQKYVTSHKRVSFIPATEYTILKVMSEPTSHKVKGTVFYAYYLQAIVCELVDGELKEDTEEIRIQLTGGDFNLLKKIDPGYPQHFLVTGTVYVNKYNKNIAGRKWIPYDITVDEKINLEL